MNLFVYGTLTFPEIVKALVGKIYKIEPAALDNYAITGLEGKPYPAIIEKQGATTNGYILYGLDDEAVKIFDQWESNEYEKCKIAAHTVSGQIDTVAYVWLGTISDLKPWSHNDFKAKYLDYYLSEKIPAFLRQYNDIQTNQL